MKRNADCFICFDSKPVASFALPCGICSKQVCLDCDVRIAVCPFCRSDLPSWDKILKESNQIQLFHYSGQYMREYLMNVRRVQIIFNLLKSIRSYDDIDVIIDCSFSFEEYQDALSLFREEIQKSLNNGFITNETRLWIKIHNVLLNEEYEFIFYDWYLTPIDDSPPYPFSFVNFEPLSAEVYTRRSISK